MFFVVFFLLFSFLPLHPDSDGNFSLTYAHDKRNENEEKLLSQDKLKKNVTKNEYNKKKT